jgi:hypothetical protein
MKTNRRLTRALCYGLLAVLLTGCESDPSTCGVETPLSEGSKMSGRVVKPGKECSYLMSPKYNCYYILTVDAPATSSSSRPSVSWIDTTNQDDDMDPWQETSGRYTKDLYVDREYLILIENQTPNDIKYSIIVEQNENELITVDVTGTRDGIPSTGYYLEYCDGRRHSPDIGFYFFEVWGGRDIVTLSNVEIVVP